MAESLSFNGTDLLTYLYAIQGTSGIVGAPPMRGGEHELPNLPGAVEGSAWPGPRVGQVRGLLYGNDGTTLVPSDARARFLDRARALSALVFNDAKVGTLTRVIPRVSGGDLTVAASARYLSGLESIEQAAYHAGRCVIEWTILDPFWFPTSDTTLSAITASASPSIAGDVATRRMTLTFSGVTATQRLTNNTTGEWVEVAGSSGAATVLDCEAFTATRSSTSVAGSVSHNGSFHTWLTLAAGTNSLTLTGGGQVVVAYRPAYL